MKQLTSVPFPTTAEKAKNVDECNIYKEYEKPHLMYSAKKVNLGELMALKHDLNGLQFVGAT